MARPGGQPKKRTVDCEAGRRMGCASYCCRLIVRLGEGERDPGRPDKGEGRCVDKDPRDGFCVYFDREQGLCAVYDRRPAVCRAFDCNEDPLLRVILRDGFSSLLRAAMTPDVEDAQGRRVPTKTMPPPNDEE